MGKVLFNGMLFLSIPFFMLAQEAKFEVEVSEDSILFGNYFKVKFSLENAKAVNFTAPEFEGFKVVSGPNMTSSFSMINGQVSQSMSYTYYLEPLEVGNYYIAPASVELEDGFLETMPLPILVIPNPEGIIQQPEAEESKDDFFKRFEFPRQFEQPLPPAEEPRPKKKKRKIIKI